MLARAVTSMEFTGTAVSSAEHALAALEHTPFDIVLSDLNLPGMQGLEMCERIRQRWPATQLVILTGYGSLDAAKAAIRLEVADFLTKPTSLGDLEAALNRALRRRMSNMTTRPVPSIDLEEPDHALHPSAGVEPPRTLQDLEREHVLAALARHDGNREATAEELGISVRTLYYRLKEYARLGLLNAGRST
jgi:DNA-binding NtrC family response regulator